MMLVGIKYIATKRPTAFAFENVKALTFKRHRPYFDQILNKLRRIKDNFGKPAYDISWKILDAKVHGGLPQSRQRVFVVGTLHNKTVSKFMFPKKVQPISVEKLLGPACLKAASQPDLSAMPDGTVRGIMMGMDRILEKGGNPLHETWFIDCKASTSRMAVKKNICPCLTRTRAAAGAFWLSNRGRFLETHEMMRMQGIDPKIFRVPTTVTIRQFHAMIGNAVAVPVLAGIIDGMCKAVGVA